MASPKQFPPPCPRRAHGDFRAAGQLSTSFQSNRWSHAWVSGLDSSLGQFRLLQSPFSFAKIECAAVMLRIVVLSHVGIVVLRVLVHFWPRRVAEASSHAHHGRFYMPPRFSVCAGPPKTPFFHAACATPRRRLLEPDPPRTSVSRWYMCYPPFPARPKPRFSL